MGGLGSNEYLLQYLSGSIPSEIEIIKPFNGWTAIARGAVLHKLGLKYMHERVLRCHYGIMSTVSFDEKIHPTNLKVVDQDGKTKCSCVMNWFAKKVGPYFIKRI